MILKERVWSSSHELWLVPGTPVVLEHWLEDGSAVARVGANLLIKLTHDEVGQILETADASR